MTRPPIQMHPHGAYRSHLKLTVGAAAAFVLADHIDDLVLGVEGVALSGDPIDPVVVGYTITPRDGAAIVWSARADLLAEHDEGWTLDGALDDYGQPIDTSLSGTGGTRSGIRGWAWKSAGEDDAVVDVNVNWTDAAAMVR